MRRQHFHQGAGAVRGETFLDGEGGGAGSLGLVFCLLEAPVCPLSGASPSTSMIDSVSAPSCSWRPASLTSHPPIAPHLGVLGCGGGTAGPARMLKQ